MHNYEIRIFRDDGGTALIFSERMLTDDAAIRSAQQMAHGRPFEIWRGMDQICGPFPAARQQS